jgi:hypothetical protein
MTYTRLELEHANFWNFIKPSQNGKNVTPAPIGATSLYWFVDFLVL